MTPLPAPQLAPLLAPLLALQKIDSFYGPVQVHFGLDLHINPGEIVCLLGGNASGKSTTMKIILGLLRPRAGRVMLDGTDITALPTPARIRAGLASVPEARRLFPAMTVRENLLMGAYLRSGPFGSGPDVAADLDRVLTLFPRVAQRIAQRAGTLSGGEQQMVALARAMMSRPRLICMDEPTMGLSPLFVDRVLELIATINAPDSGERTAIFMVEQNASLALRIAHRGYVLQTGRIVLHGPAADLLSNPAIRDAYLGQAA